MKKEIYNTTPPHVNRNRGIAGTWLYGLVALFLPPSHIDSPYTAQLRYPISPGLSLWLRLVALFAPARAAVHGIGWAAMHCLLTLCLALGANWANAQAQDSRIDVPVGNDMHIFDATDFGARLGNSVTFISRPTYGRLIDLSDNNMVEIRGDVLAGEPGDVFFAHELNGENDGSGAAYTLPADAISVANGYDSFAFSIEAGGVSTEAIMTINLVGASTQMAASGAPTVAAAMGHTAYNVGVPLTASITGVTELNGINVETLAWKWQQADAPASGAPMASAYSDIAGATATGAASSDFTPLVAHAGKYIRVCAAFMDQFSTPAASGDLCSTGSQVTNAPFFGDASVDDQVWVTGTAIAALVLPEAMFGNGTLTYSLIPTSLPTGLSFDAVTRTISGTPTATTSQPSSYVWSVADDDGDTTTLLFDIEISADAKPAFATEAAIADQTWITGTAITDLVLPAATGGNGALTYTLTPALPAGLSLDVATRTISGTPTAAAQSNYTWTAADADNNTASSDTTSLTFSVISNIRLRLRLFLEGPLR